MKTIHTDILVIGAGLAGSSYALQMARRGLKVELLSAGDPLMANSDLAQGGIIYDRGGKPDDLVADILAASGGTANPAAARALAEDGAAAVEEVLFGAADVKFDCGSDGALDFTKEGGHHRRRIIHSKDTTGHAILEKVAQTVAACPDITRRTNHVAIDLLTLSHSCADPLAAWEPSTCFGAYVLDVDRNEVVAIVARHTVLATGGLGSIYLHTTNQPGAVGHGIAMAHRAGARVKDLEFVQFHPTSFYSPNAPRWLISEAVRGEGAVLVNRRGEDFMKAVHEMGSLAPRDVVAQAIHREMASTGEPCAYLDISKLKDIFKTRFPAIYKKCLDWGIDPEREEIPVVPAAHYTCGGVYASLSGQTSIRHLSAIGETACTGLHGANRLASTSLLECLTSAIAAGDQTERDLHDDFEADPKPPTPKPWQSPALDADPVLVRQDMDYLRTTMWNYAGIVRSPRRLMRARAILKALDEQVTEFYRECRPTRELIELRNAITTGLLVVTAASLNGKSQGSHCLVAD